MLTKDGKRRPFTVHRLVALAFHSGKRNALHNEVAHLDGDRTNPRADNLKWVSKVENHFHMRAHGTHPAGIRQSGAKLTDEIVRRVRSLPPGQSLAETARRLGVHYETLRRARQGRTWRHVGQTSSHIAIAAFCSAYFGAQLLRVSDRNAERHDRRADPKDDERRAEAADAKGVSQ
jgi:transposase-like protein